ncbi:MAG: HYR domain-containing protein, partial [Bacteroidota bacterium]
MKTISTKFSWLVSALLVLALGFAPTTAHAGLIFDGSPGTAAPPPTLGSYTMTPFGDDTRPNGIGNLVNSVPSPLGGDLGFSMDLDHVHLGGNWTANWMSGYDGGDLYFTGFMDDNDMVTMTLPANTLAFYFYAQPNDGGTYTFEAIGSDGTSSGPIDILGGTSGAGQYFGFYSTDPGCKIASIQVSFTGSSGGFAVGQFGIAASCDLVVDCSNIVDTEIACRADLPAVDFDLPIVTDSCGDVIRSALTIIPGNSACPEDTVFITRTYFLQDQEGNMDQCMQTFTTISNNGPTITCPDDDFIDCDAGAPVVSADNATAVFECSSFGASPSNSVTVSAPVVDGTPGEVGTTYTYTYTATDGCGRSASCEQVITVQDTVPPTIECITEVPELYLDEMGLFELDDFSAFATVSDNCGLDTMYLSRSVVSCVDATGENLTVTAMAIDNGGNLSSCDFEVMVLDTLPPVLVCPDDIEQGNDSGECGAVVEFETPIALDNCALDMMASLNIGSSNQDNEEGVMFDVSVPAGADPVQLTRIRVDIESPGQDYDIQVFFKMGTNSGFLTDQSAWTFLASEQFDNAPGKIGIEIPGVNIEPGEMVALYIVNVNGGLDLLTFDPAATPVTDGQISVDNSREVNTNDIGPFGDNDDNGNEFPSAVIEYVRKSEAAMLAGGSPMSGDFFPVGTTPITFTATDQAGNMASCSFDVTVNDDEVPTLGCPATFIASLDENGIDTTMNAEMGFTTDDNCFVEFPRPRIIGGINNRVFGCDDAGMTFDREFFVTDSAGNSSDTCTVQIIVVDEIAPVVTCPADVTIECDEDPAPFFEGSGEEGLEVLTFDTPTSWADGETGEVVL